MTTTLERLEEWFDARCGTSELVAGVEETPHGIELILATPIDLDTFESAILQHDHYETRRQSRHDGSDVLFVLAVEELDTGGTVSSKVGSTYGEGDERIQFGQDRIIDDNGELDGDSAAETLEHLAIYFDACDA